MTIKVLRFMIWLVGWEALTDNYYRVVDDAAGRCARKVRFVLRFCWHAVPTAQSVGWLHNREGGTLSARSLPIGGNESLECFWLDSRQIWLHLNFSSRYFSKLDEHFHFELLQNLQRLRIVVILPQKKYFSNALISLIYLARKGTPFDLDSATQFLPPSLLPIIDGDSANGCHGEWHTFIWTRMPSRRELLRYVFILRGLRSLHWMWTWEASSR